MVLQQLSRLGSNVKERYATEQELKFVTNFQASLQQRIAIYRILRINQRDIISSTYERSHHEEPNLFPNDNQALHSLCRRDAQKILMYASFAVLTDDLEGIKENLLIWQKTIIKAFDHKKYVQVFYRKMTEVINEKLLDKEIELLEPALTLIVHTLAD